MLGHKISDVYVLTYLPTGKKYVGRSTNVENRMQLHMCLLRHGKHNSKELQQDYNRYGGGVNAFSIETVGKYRHDRCSADNDLEFQTMIALKTYDERYGYNTHDCAMQKIRKANGLSPIYLSGRLAQAAREVN